MSETADRQDAQSALYPLELDDSQRAVLQLSLGQSRAVIGAPGSGKTETLLSLYGELLANRGLDDGEVLVLGPNRLVAAQLRAQLDERISKPSGAPRVRTSSALALAVLSADRRARGELPLRLLTGAVQDEIVAAVLGARLAGASGIGALTRDVLGSLTFRNQFRELLRVLDEHEISPARLRELGAEFHVAEWADVAEIVEAYQDELSTRYPHHRDASSLHRDAVGLLNTVPVNLDSTGPIGDFARLKVVLIDDAQEITDSAVNLMRAFARRGVTVIAFGDPDLATSASQGSARSVLNEFGSALGQKVQPALMLSNVYRNRAMVRDAVVRFSKQIGAAGFGQQRSAVAVKPGGEVRFSTFATAGESAGAIAHLLRERHLGLGGAEPMAGVPWAEMAVICRTRHEAQKLARQLNAAQVPTGVTAGGTVLAEHPIVRHLLQLAQLAFGWREPTAADVERFLTGPVGGLDALGLNRLRTTLQLAAAREGHPDSADALMLNEFMAPVPQLDLDTRQSRALTALASVFASGRKACAGGGDLSEVLWALWDATPLPAHWEKQALRGRGVSAADANTALDAVMSLFFATARFEEQEVELDREEFVQSVLESSLPEDSLARSSRRDVVTVTTPQGMIGRSAEVVVVTQLHDGVWPNLKTRGSLLHLERLTNIAIGAVDAPVDSRRAVMHDELRMLVQAISRSKNEVLIAAVHNEDTMPSPFFSYGANEQLTELSSLRLTLRGLVASLRRRINEHPDDKDAAEQLAILAAEGVEGADPDQWYGVMPPSSDAPLVDLEMPGAPVSVSPSRLEKFDDCPLDWAIARLGGERTVSAAAIGTLVHLALETVAEPTVDAIMARIDAGWAVLSFDAKWEERRSHLTAEAMVEGLTAYLNEFRAKGGALLGAEQRFELDYGHAHIRGTVDRVELIPSAGEQPAKVLIVDLKTQRQAPTGADLEAHPQLAVYQLAVKDGKVPTGDAEPGGAALLLVHPKATGQKQYKLAVQDPLTDEARAELIARIEKAAIGMAASTFTAEVEHHCTDPYAFGNCRIHIVRPVSFA